MSTGFRKAVMEFYQQGRDNGELYKRRRYGTWSLPGRANASKSQATLNFKEGYSEAFVKYEDPEVIRDLIRVRDEACFSCPFACGKRSRIKDPDYPLTAKGPEHETMALLGTNCGLGDMEDICRANYLCNEFGMDTITAGAMVSCAMELFEEGHLPEKETRLSAWVREQEYAQAAQGDRATAGRRRSHGRGWRGFCGEIRPSGALHGDKGYGHAGLASAGVRCPRTPVRNLQYRGESYEVDYALL